MLLLLTLGLALLILGPGYLVWLRRGVRPPEPRPPQPTHWPDVDLIIPVHNEAPWLRTKLTNLSQLDYPKDRLRAIWVDGGSTDGTADLITRVSEANPQWSVITLPVSGKTRQLNEALQTSWARWVLVTDGDAHLPPDTLKRMVALGESHPDLQVVGTMTRPAGAMGAERAHWALLNRIRRREAARGFALVTGPCFLFRRDLLRSFPADVVADDVYATFLAAQQGARVGLVETTVTELRTPRSVRELARHKARKADAYMREVYRFLPSAEDMPMPVRGMFLWRGAQFLFFPAGVVLWGMFAALWVTVNAPLAWVPIALVAGALLVNARARAGMLLAALLTGSLLAALFTAPGRRQTATFDKVGPIRRVGLKDLSAQMDPGDASDVAREQS